jgi:hypothetical protein
MILYCTANTGWGFTSAVESAPINAAAAFDAAAREIGLVTGTSPWAACVFLDSRHGRHFGDDVVNAIGDAGGDAGKAVHIAVGRWLDAPAQKDLREKAGAPAGTDALTALCVIIETQMESVPAHRVVV